MYEWSYSRWQEHAFPVVFRWQRASGGGNSSGVIIYTISMYMHESLCVRSRTGGIHKSACTQHGSGIGRASIAHGSRVRSCNAEAFDSSVPSSRIAHYRPSVTHTYARNSTVVSASGTTHRNSDWKCESRDLDTCRVTFNSRELEIYANCDINGAYTPRDKRPLNQTSPVGALKLPVRYRRGTVKLTGAKAKLNPKDSFSFIRKRNFVISTFREFV